MRFFTLLLLISSFFSSANEMALDPKIAFLAPYLGTWQSTFESGAQDISHWERALNGKAIRTLHSINKGEYGGESLIFWDKEKDSLVFYYFTTAGFHTQGKIIIEDARRFTAIEQVSGNKDGITQVKSTSTLSDNKMTVSSSYYKQGNWTKPQARSYTRSNERVIFK